MVCVCVRACVLKTVKEGEVGKTKEMKQNTLIKMVIMYDVCGERSEGCLFPISVPFGQTFPTGVCS